jgi:hypothetical protein
LKHLPRAAVEEVDFDVLEKIEREECFEREDQLNLDLFFVRIILTTFGFALTVSVYPRLNKKLRTIT